MHAGNSRQIIKDVFMHINCPEKNFCNFLFVDLI